MFTHRSCGMIDNLLGGQVALVAHQQLIDIFACVSLDLLQPLLDIVKGLLVRAIVHNNYSVGATIV